jgi:glutathione S-transferase
MKFYDCATAPSPRRVRIFIAEKGLDIETVQVDLASGEHLSDAFRQLNPQCTVPVLELDDGTCLNDSISISLYLDETYHEPNLMGRNAREKAVISMWQREMDSNGFLALGE